MSDAPTEAEAAACLDEVAAVLADLGIETAVARVREHSGWTDLDTGEHYPSHWVIEARRSWPGERTRVAVFEFEDWRACRVSPGAWTDMLRMELDSWR